MNFNLIKLAKIFIYLAPFSVLIVLPTTFFPFIGGKYYFFRTAISLALICVLLYWGFEDREGKIIKDFKNVFKSPLVKVVSLFALIYVLASVFAFDPLAAFWSNYERQEGGFQMIHYWLFFILMTVLFKRDDEWFKIFWISIFSAIGMIFYGILSAAFVSGFFGPYADLISQTSTPGLLEALLNKNIRFQGSLGNPAYVAPYLMFIIFYCLFLWLRQKPEFNLKSLFYILLALFFGLFFVLSQTRGAFLGIVAGVFIFFIFLIFINPKLRKVGIIGLIILFLIGGLIFYFKDSNLIKNLPGSRFLQINFKDRTAQTRFWTWQSAWQGFKDRPILGWGPENFPVVFDKYFNIHHFNPQEGGSETWFDRAHSVIFDYLAETGILGLLSYLAIFIVLIILFFRYLKNKNLKNIKINDMQLSLILAMTFGYFVQNLIIFEVLPMYLNFFIFLAFVNYLFFKKPNEILIKK